MTLPQHPIIFYSLDGTYCPWWSSGFEFHAITHLMFAPVVGICEKLIWNQLHQILLAGIQLVGLVADFIFKRIFERRGYVLTTLLDLHVKSRINTILQPQAGPDHAMDIVINKVLGTMASSFSSPSCCVDRGHLFIYSCLPNNNVQQRTYSFRSSTFTGWNIISEYFSRNQTLHHENK